MQALAALGDAPIAAIAVVAILLGVLLLARGPREKRAARGESGADESGPAPQPGPAPEPEPASRPQPQPQPELEVPQEATEPAPPPASDAPLSEAPPAAADPEPPAEEAPPQSAEPATATEPAWRLAARAANSAVRFRHGTIKIGGKPTGKRKGD